jgi:hypothetical protein
VFVLRVLVAFFCTAFARICTCKTQIGFVIAVKRHLLGRCGTERSAFHIELNAFHKMAYMRFIQACGCTQAASGHAFEAGINTVLKVVGFHSCFFSKHYENRTVMPGRSF